jgi:hypothetical protein
MFHLSGPYLFLFILIYIVSGLVFTTCSINTGFPTHLIDLHRKAQTMICSHGSKMKFLLSCYSCMCFGNTLRCVFVCFLIRSIMSSIQGASSSKLTLHYAMRIRELDQPALFKVQAWSSFCRQVYTRRNSRIECFKVEIWLQSLNLISCCITLCIRV